MEASFYKQLSEHKVRCLLCPRKCVINSGKQGWCGVRENKQGVLHTLVYAKPCSMAIDPIEKKPLYHFLPGSKIFSIATTGCNLGCEWCQNWEIAHPKQQVIIAPYGEVRPEEVIKRCEENHCELIAFTYTEPTVFYEYMLAIAKLAKKHHIRTVLVSNGYIEQEPLEQLMPFLDAANIDLKAFTEKAYHHWTGGLLQPVLDTILRLHRAGIHLELTTLIIPEVNDDAEQLESLYSWIEQSLGKEQVIHISRFFPYYKMLNKELTSVKTLREAEMVARKHLHYVYLGNVGTENNTVCPICSKTVITRNNRFSSVTFKQGRCTCGHNIPGVWK